MMETTEHSHGRDTCACPAPRARTRAPGRAGPLHDQRGRRLHRAHRAHPALVRADRADAARRPLAHRPAPLHATATSTGSTFVGKLRLTGMPVADMVRYAELVREGEHTFGERQRAAGGDPARTSCAGSPSSRTRSPCSTTRSTSTRTPGTGVGEGLTHERTTQKIATVATGQRTAPRSASRASAAWA